MKYIKAIPEVARLVNKAQIAARTPDGNYILMENDLLILGPSSSYDTLVPALGCRIMTASELRAEQLGATPSELPQPTDPRVLKLMEPEGKEGNEVTEGQADGKGGE